MKAVVAAFNQEKALVGAFSVITNLRMELFEALVSSVLVVMVVMVMTVLMQIRDCVVEHHTAKTWVEMEGVGNTLAHCRSVSSVGEHSNSAQAAGSVRRQPCTRTREPTVTSSW